MQTVLGIEGRRMAKRSSKKRAKDSAWSSFSRYIRLRDCIATTGDYTKGFCITCSREYPFKKLQAGHLIGGRNNAVLFDEEIVNAQCIICNVYKGGNYVRYAIVMTNRHSVEWVENKLKASNETIKYTEDDYKEIREKYDKKSEHLLSEIA